MLLLPSHETHLKHQCLVSSVQKVERRGGEEEEGFVLGWQVGYDDTFFFFFPASCL